MGISDNLLGSSGEVDCSVGTIVWVRRRNGSWWPGRVVGTSELSASHLMSPRSGTPVKLLGREDASVDWYNLEKSKRVKAFRCGEFDDCIERAESSQGVSIKKREKYARREDAILHALELEREQQDKKDKKQGKTSNCKSSRMPGASRKEFITPENIDDDNCKFVNLKSQPHSERLDLSLEEESMGDPSYAQIAKHGKRLSRGDDFSEAIPRMRGLEDFGLRTAPSKRKFSAFVTSEGSQRPLLLSGGCSMEDMNHVNSSKNSLVMKRKRPRGGLVEESLVKRRDRRRTLVQVLQTSAKLPVSHSLQCDDDAVSITIQGEREQTGVIRQSKDNQCVYLSNDSLGLTEFPSDQMQISPTRYGTDYCLHPDSLTEESSSSGSIEEEESDSSEEDYLDSEMDGKVAVLSGPKNSSRHVGSGNYRLQGKLGSMRSKELVESAITGYVSQLHPHDQIASSSADVGVSKWKLKGKRNIRNLTKKSTELINGKHSNGSIHGSFFKGNILNGNANLGFGYDEDDMFEKYPVQTQKLGFGNRRYPSTPKASQVALRGYWDESGEYFDPIYASHGLGNGLNSVLVDVDLKVQSSYQGEHVPLVSLMSRLNGKAIIGHPIQIETLEDSFSDILLSTNDDFSEESTDIDESKPVPPVWTTARRTAMHRVPRSHTSSALDGDEVAYPQYSDLEKKPPDKKARSMGKFSSSIARPLTEKKFPKKLMKKVSFSSQKTRTLSSIGTEQKLRQGCNPKRANGSRLDSLIKPKETGPIAVSCIPVKLVFSRLLEAVGKSPSGAEKHGVLVDGITERKPS